MMNNINSSQVCAIAYFRDFRGEDWKKEFFTYARNMSQSLGVDLNYFSIGIESTTPQFFKGKMYRMIKKNIEKLQYVIEGDARVTDLCFYYSTFRDVAHNGSLYIQINNETHGRPYRKIYTQFLDSLRPRANHFSIIYEAFDTVDKFVNIDYAFYTYLPSNILPFFYFNDIFINNLSRAEIKNLALWISNSDFYPSRLRGFYDGNIFGEGILNSMKEEGIDLQKVLYLLDEIPSKKLHTGKIFFSLTNDRPAMRELIELLSPQLIKITGNEIFPI